MKIKVLDHIVTLMYVEKKSWTGDSCGDFQDTEMTVRILKDLPESLERITLLHELVHVYQFLTGREMNEDEANLMALFLHSLIKNNKTILNV